MNKNKLQFIDLFNDRLEKDDFENLCMSENEIKDYKIGDWDPYVIFEGDPDYMIDEDGNIIYFVRIKDKVYYINTARSDENMGKLEEFIMGQNPKITPAGYNSRSETKNWEYFDDGIDFNAYKGLKIAYRGGCGYYYTCFKYT